MKKINVNYEFSKKRDPNIITPCCGKRNKGAKGGLKFVNYVGLPNQYGYCHSCGTTTLPPPIYEDTNGNHYTYNKSTNKYEPLHYKKPKLTRQTTSKKIIQKFIDENIAINSISKTPENNLLKYLRKTYGNDKTDKAKEEYLIGTHIDGATMFWQINKHLKVQKCQLAYYNDNGRRSNRFNSIYENKDGFYTCLYGEHLIIDKLKGKQKIILVESEKTAIIGSILIPRFTWLSYSGINGLTNNRIKALRGHRVLIIPDMHKEAIDIIKNKIPFLKQNDIKVNIWDLTTGKTKTQLENQGLFKGDIEDIFRKLI